MSQRRRKKKPVVEGAFDNRSDAMKGVRWVNPKNGRAGAHPDNSKYSRKRKHKEVL